MQLTTRRLSFLASLAVWLTVVVCALLSSKIYSTDDSADLVTRQTARVAVLFWGASAAALLLYHRHLGRLWWTLACFAYLIHVATAFDRVHDWSHSAAFNHVDEVSGFGPGIFVSYLFSILWLADVLWWLFWPRTYESRSTWLDRAIHGFIAFVVFNGTIVYETGFIRWVGIAIFTVLATLMMFRIVRRRRT